MYHIPRCEGEIISEQNLLNFGAFCLTEVPYHIVLCFVREPLIISIYGYPHRGDAAGIGITSS
jgi:hypothetical protein